MLYVIPFYKYFQQSNYIHIYTHTHILNDLGCFCIITEAIVAMVIKQIATVEDYVNNQCNRHSFQFGVHNHIQIKFLILKLLT
uniref:Uncharacterized protein n=1 Tax=Octopus bimaculoides TaxID=37653 RepID=A0A0L8HCP0_OCTBM